MALEIRVIELLCSSILQGKNLKLRHVFAWGHYSQLVVESGFIALGSRLNTHT